MMNPTAGYANTSGTATSKETVTAGQMVSETIQLSEGLPRVAVVAVLEDAAVAVASSSLAPLVSVVQAANAGQRHHLGVR